MSPTTSNNQQRFRRPLSCPHKAHILVPHPHVEGIARKAEIVRAKWVGKLQADVDESMVEERNNGKVAHLHNYLHRVRNVDRCLTRARSEAKADCQATLESDQAVREDNAQHQQVHVRKGYLGIRISENEPNGATGFDAKLVQLGQHHIVALELPLRG